MSGAMASGQILTNLLIKTEQADCVTLQRQKIRESSRESSRILGLGVAARAESHRAAMIGHDITAEIGFVFEFLNEIPIAAGVHPPIDVTRIIIGTVLAVLSKFG